MNCKQNALQTVKTRLAGRVDVIVVYSWDYPPRGVETLTHSSTWHTVIHAHWIARIASYERRKFNAAQPWITQRRVPRQLGAECNFTAFPDWSVIYDLIWCLLFFFRFSNEMKARTKRKKVKWKSPVQNNAPLVRSYRVAHLSQQNRANSMRRSEKRFLLFCYRMLHKFLFTKVHPALDEHLHGGTAWTKAWTHFIRVATISCQGWNNWNTKLHSNLIQIRLISDWNFIQI